MGPILVFGHINPDNDSICSAVAYAHLKNLKDAENVYVPARLGPLPSETTWVFSRFGVEPPALIEHVNTRVQDVMTEDVVTVNADDNMLVAGRSMREHGVRALPVLADGEVKGLLNVQILAERYIEETSIAGFREKPVSVLQLARVMDGELLVGDDSTTLSGGVLIGAMEPSTMQGYIKPGDTLIVGDRLRTQPMAIESGVACIVITGGSRPEEDVLELAREKNVAIVVTKHDTYAAARLANMCHSAEEMMDTGILLVEPETLLSEATEDLLTSPHREAVVIDDDRTPLGMLTRTNVARGMRRRVILVDHNETSQSAIGIENADIVEIVDHHRVGDVQTTGPILFVNHPVGSTATIVAERYREAGVDVPKAMAGLLLSAILSDTVLLKSPTACDLDHRVVEHLASVVGVNPIEFGMEMFRTRSSGHLFSAEDALKADLKEYRVGDVTVAIGQTETVELMRVMEHADELKLAMESLREAKGYDLVMLMVTDVVREGSEILVVGKMRLAERALGVSLTDGSAWMAGVLSRKKQIAALLIDEAQS